jgi:hypothetical protein
LTSNPQSRNGTIESYGLKTEVLYASKLGCAEIIPAVEQKNSGRTKLRDFWQKAAGNERGMGVCVEAAEAPSIPTASIGVGLCKGEKLRHCVPIRKPASIGIC